MKKGHFWLFLRQKFFKQQNMGYWNFKDFLKKLSPMHNLKKVLQHFRKNSIYFIIELHYHQLVNVVMSQVLVRHPLISSFLCHHGSSYTIITWLSSTDEKKRRRRNAIYYPSLDFFCHQPLPRTDSETGKSIQVFQFIVFSNNLQFWDKSRYTITE